MKRACMEMRPSRVADLAAIVALYRPGPMQHIGTYCRAKNGEEVIQYPHPDLADILDETYGVITFQDQVLKIAQKFAGYSLGAADIMRKAMGKKIASMMEAERERFISGAMAKGYSEPDAVKVFELIEPFAGYAFNKAHSYSYGTIAYQTAYLKAHYLPEYMAAILMQAQNHPAGGLARIAQAYSECLRAGIAVLPPDVNRSNVNFSLEDAADGRTAIRFGLAAIKNVGSGAAEEVVQARCQAGGAFASLDDFCRRVNARSLNKRALESLIKAGALDSLAGVPEPRGGLLLNVDRILSIAQRAQRLRETGQATMFDLFGDEVATPLAGPALQSAPIPKGEQLAWEKELLGVYVSEHPFQRVAPRLAPLGATLCHEITPELLESAPPQGRDLVVAGMVTSTRRLATRDGRPFIAAEIEDLSGSVEVTVWPDVYEATAGLWSPGKVLLLQVRARERSDRLTVGVLQVAPLDGDFSPPAWLSQPAEPPANGPGRTEAPAVGRERPPPLPGPVPPAASSQPPATPLPADAKPPPASRRLVLQETEDESEDQRRLAAVFRLLRERPGEGRLVLTVRTRDGGEVELALPPASLDDDLLARVEAVLAAPASVS
jgi:DNA polymerase-3 subunit alpha